MSPGGWIAMVLAVGSTTAFFAWCLLRVLRTPGASEHIHSSSDLEPPDRQA
jgi:hypothetical protein